jgi:hypothetical protein
VDLEYGKETGSNTYGIHGDDENFTNITFNQQLRELNEAALPAEK